MLTGLHVRRDWQPALARFAVLLVGLGLGALTGSRPLVGAAVAVVLLLGFLASLRPDMVTVLVVGLIYSNAPAVATRNHGLPNSVSVAILAVLALPLLYHLLIRREPIALPAPLPWIAAYTIVQIVSLIAAEDTGLAVSAFETFLTEGLILYVAVINVVRTEHLLRQIVWTLLIVGAIMGSLSAYQTVTESYENDFLGFAQVKEEALERRASAIEEEPPDPRLAGPIGEKNRYAQIMIMLIPLGLMLWQHESHPAARLAAMLLTGLVLAGAALTYSRGGAIGLVLVLIVMAMLRRLSMFQLFAIVAATVVLLGAFPRLAERMITIESAADFTAGESSTDDVDGATLGRMGASLAAIEVFTDHPIIGVGPGMFPYYYREKAMEVGLRVHETTRAAHNLYPHIAAESGALGLTAFLGAVVVTLRDLRRASIRWVRRNPRLSALQAGLLLALVAYLSTGIFLHLAYARYFWLIMALAAAAPHVVQEHGDRGEPRSVTSASSTV